MSKNIIQIVEAAWTVERTYSIRQLQFEDAPRTTFFEDVVHVILEILLTGGALSSSGTDIAIPHKIYSDRVPTY
mgnify:CR=1 FL=1